MGHRFQREKADGSGRAASVYDGATERRFLLHTEPDGTRTDADAALPPTYLNLNSHWWDASQIYGNNEQELRAVRCPDKGEGDCGPIKLMAPPGEMPGASVTSKAMRSMDTRPIKGTDWPAKTPKARPERARR